VILLDANLLLYGYYSDADMHPPAKIWLEKTLSGDRTVSFAWIVLLAFLRITTRPGVFPQPLSVEEALRRMESWLNLKNTVVLQPGPRHSQILGDLLTKTGTGANLTSDAHLAALAWMNPVRTPKK